MYGYSSLLRGALCLGILSGVFAASLHSFQQNPNQILHDRGSALRFAAAIKNYPTSSNFLLWRTADRENCAFGQEDAEMRLELRMRTRCQSEGGTVLSAYVAPDRRQAGMCRGLVECKLPMNSD